MKQLKKRLNVLVSAGPTREAIDPVRFISNYSTGFFGYELARQAKARGHRVILISGPTALVKPKGVHSIDVLTASQMQKELKKKWGWCDCLIMTAAICDFRLKKMAKKKIKRRTTQEMTLALEQNPDILGSFGQRKDRKLMVGFALETENLKQNAQQKLREKNLDLIVATQITKRRYPFGSARLAALIMDRNGGIRQTRPTTKAHLSRILLDSIEKTVL